MLDNVDIHQNPNSTGQLFITDVICNFRVTNTDNAPVSVSIDSSLHRYSGTQFRAARKLSDPTVGANVDYYGFVPKYSYNYCWIGDQYVVRDTITKDDSSDVLSDTITNPFDILNQHEKPKSSLSTEKELFAFFQSVDLRKLFFTFLPIAVISNVNRAVA